MESFEEKFAKLKAEAAALGITTRELARRRHIQVLEFAKEHGSEFAQMAIDDLKRQKY